MPGGGDRGILWGILKQAGLTSGMNYITTKEADLLEMVNAMYAEQGKPPYVPRPSVRNVPPPRKQATPTPLPKQKKKKDKKGKKPKPVEDSEPDWDDGIPLEEEYTPQPGIRYAEGYDADHTGDPAYRDAPPVPQSDAPVHSYAGENAYSGQDEEAPLRTDAEGRIWYREEVTKPASPKPRARRRLTYVDPGTKTQTVVNGRYVETVEVAGEGSRIGEVRITMPSYQVGVYKDPRFPFKIHVYAGNRGFNLQDVQNFYGGYDLVPPEVKRIYIGNDLCYDMRTTIRAIQAEYRQQQLKGSA